MKRTAFLASLAAVAAALGITKPAGAANEVPPRVNDNPAFVNEFGQVERSYRAIPNERIRAAVQADRELIRSLLPVPDPNGGPGITWRELRSTWVVDGDTWSVRHRIECCFLLPAGEFVEPRVVRVARVLEFSAGTYIEERDGLRHRDIRRSAEAFYHAAHQASVGGLEAWKEIYRQRAQFGRPKPFRIALGQPVDFRRYDVR